VNALAQLLLQTATPTISVGSWVGVRPRFTQFLANLEPTSEEVSGVATSLRRITRCLNLAYWNSSSEADNRLIVGSWGKQTCIRPPTDADMLFCLPVADYERLNQRLGNKQSALLQEVKGHLQGTYSQTDMRGDGQVVMVRLGHIVVEVVPAFMLQDGGFWICDTNDGGRYKATYPVAEAARIHDSNKLFNGNTIHLIKMAKCWKNDCAVPLSSFHIELLAVDFINQWPHRGHDVFWYDWIMRDFFDWLLAQARLGYWWRTLPGSGELVYLGNEWVSKAESAASRATKACDFERDNLTIAAGQEWQKIFGGEIPVYV